MATPWQTTTPHMLGLLMGSGQLGSTQTLNAAATWEAFSIMGNGKTISEVRAFFSATAESLIASDITVEIYSSSTGHPNASVAGPYNCNSAPSGAGWYTWTPSLALTAGTQYWAVFKNANGTPTSNFPTFRFMGSGDSVFQSGGGGAQATGRYGPSIRANSTNSGGAWSATYSTGGIRFGFSDSTYTGLATSNIAASADLIFGSQESGVQFTSPANVSLNVAGVAFYLGATTGSPTGNLTAKIYTGGSPSLQATSNAVPNTDTLTAGWIPFIFSSDVVISASTVVTATLKDTAADSSGAAFKMDEITIDSDSHSLALLPFGGTLEKAFWNGSTWTLTNAAVFPFALMLDTNGEFAASGGPIGSNMSGGFCNG